MSTCESCLVCHQTKQQVLSGGEQMCEALDSTAAFAQNVDQCLAVALLEAEGDKPQSLGELLLEFPHKEETTRR